MSLSEDRDGSSLLIFVDEGYYDDFCIENQFDEVCDPLEAGIWTGIPDIEPKKEIKRVHFQIRVSARTCRELSAAQFHPVDSEQPSSQVHKTSIPPSLNEGRIQNYLRTI
jgi:hypothetical protein